MVIVMPNKISRKSRADFKEVEKRYNAFINNSEDGIWCYESTVPIPIDQPDSTIIDKIFIQGVLVECNNVFAKMHSFKSVDDIIGMPLKHFLDKNVPENISIIKSFIQNDFRLSNMEYHRTAENGVENIYIINLFGVVENNNLVQTWGIQRDITAQMHAREKIQSLSAQIERFSQISADIITITDEKELFRRISDAIVEISDFSRVMLYTFKDSPPYRDILGHVGISEENLQRIQSADARKEKYLDLFKNGIRLGNQSCYIPHTMKYLVNQHTVDFGKKKYFQNDGWHREDNVLVALKNKSGDIVGMISLDDSKSGKKPTDETVKPIELFANHISQILKLKQQEIERREIEDRFQRSEKLRALGEMAGGVAHDFNNVLSAILGRAQLLKRDITDPEILHGLEIIEKAAIDGAATIKRIQEFTRLRTDKKFEKIDINDTIRDSIKFTRTRWKNEAEEKGITYEIKTEYGDDLYVEANRAEMCEVFTNLILNSIDAMPEGGKITITTRPDEDNIITSIKDNGPGMDAETRKRAFDPFFTTRGVQGTGLGLSVSYGIVQRHSGDITIDSSPGNGTTVTIQLPLNREQLDDSSHAKTPDKNDAQNLPARILVVDDEEDPRELLKDVLETYGHTVITADSGKNALKYLADEPDIRIIFTDLGMPEMSGWELSQKINDLFPDAVIAVITGWGTQLDPQRLNDCGIIRVIAKPFQVDQIKTLVTDCLKKLADTSKTQ